MKKLLCIALAALTALSLAACRQNQASAPETSQQLQPASPAQLGREDHTELVYFLEGMESKVPATLYIGQGYSIYIEDEGFLHESGTVGSFPADIWKSAYAEQMQFQVVNLGSKSTQEAQDWLKSNHPDFRFTLNEFGALWGQDDGFNVVYADFRSNGDSMYAIIRLCTLEATEGFGARADQMAATIEFY